MENVKKALVLGLRDYVHKTGFSQVHMGLSGGIDSAVVAGLACEALGAKNVSLIALPTRFNADESLTLARTLAKNYGANFIEMPVEESFKSLVSTYENSVGPREFSLIHENMQARIRGLLLMAFANDKNSMLLTTGNKSEYATGYTTLYGDMCGGLAVIGDLLKGEVYAMAHCLNSAGEKIPPRIIDRPPSAELRQGQKDSDSLPAYDVLDNAVSKLVSSKKEATGETEEWVLQRLMLSEFKRWQAPPVLKVSSHGFGQGRRMPIAHKAWY